MKRQQGFTLVEIAIVLVIIGLILGGILKGQELIDSARVRSISTDMNGIRTAWFAFQDRYNGLPGDFSNATSQIDNTLTNDGDGDGTVEDAAEMAGVWEHLAAAGFISGNYDGAGANAGSVADTDCATSTCPQNPFNGFYKIGFTNQGAGNGGNANELVTGSQIPVNIILQLDLKLDDGNASQGELRVHSTTSNGCEDAAGEWNIAGGQQNCAAVLRGF